MSLTKNIITDKVESVDTELGWHNVQVREAHIIIENGKEISRSNHRYLIHPTDDWSSYPSEVQAICNVVHTTERQNAYTNYMNSSPEDDS